MSDVNKVMLVGRLGAKPELRKTASGEAVCNLRVATSYTSQRSGQFERETLWHAVTVFGKQAEQCATHLDKGRVVYVEGTLRPSEWTAKDGAVHHGREVRASHVAFIDGRAGGSRAAEAAAA
jgi:single-strand DNA-binding protein